jgi:hypothetical protein
MSAASSAILCAVDEPSTAILAWLLFGTIGTVAAILAVRSVVRGEYLTAVAALGAAAFCYGLISPLAKIVRRKVTPRVEVFGPIPASIYPSRYRYLA